MSRKSLPLASLGRVFRYYCFHQNLIRSGRCSPNRWPARKTPHVSQLFNSTQTGDPDTLLYGMYHSSVGGTWASPEYLKDAEVDRLLGEGRTAADDAGREAAYAALNARLLELAPSIFGYDVQAVFAASNRVKVPALSDPAMAFGLDGMGFSFRLMEMTE